jgi:uncharacterized protein (DUF2062 family)
MRLPTKEEILKNSYLKKYSYSLKNEVYWKRTRRGNTVGAATGAFAALLPIPFQMVVAVPLCIKFKGNIPISLILVWVTNPITMPFILYAQYLLGSYLLGTEMDGEIMEVIANSIYPLLVGAGITSVIGSVLAGYIAYLISSD